jgi:hypothetical protein
MNCQADNQINCRKADNTQRCCLHCIHCNIDSDYILNCKPAFITESIYVCDLFQVRLVWENGK